MEKYNDIKAHLYICTANNGYNEFLNILDYFIEKNKNKIPKWLLSKEPKNMIKYEINESIFTEYLIRSRFYTLNEEKPEFEIRNRSMKL